MEDQDTMLVTVQEWDDGLAALHYNAAWSSGNVGGSDAPVERLVLHSHEGKDLP